MFFSRVRTKCFSKDRVYRMIGPRLFFKATGFQKDIEVFMGRSKDMDLSLIKTVVQRKHGLDPEKIGISMIDGSRQSL